MRWFFLMLVFSFWGLMSCRKIIQPAPTFNTKIEEHRQAEKVESDSDIGLLICGTYEGIAAFTEFKEWNRYLTENLKLDSIDVETVPNEVYTLWLTSKLKKMEACPKLK